MSFDATIDRSDTDESEKTKGRYYVGSVFNLNDPEGIGRVQASVPGLYDPTQGDVPWIGPLRQSPFGIGPGFGFYGVPALKSKITVILQDGDPHYPMFIGGILTKDDVLPAFRDPNVWGFKDPSGNALIVDMKNGTWTFIHSSGDTIAFDSVGNRATLIKGTDTTRVNKDFTIIVDAPAKIYSSARIDLQAPLTTFNSIQPVN